ncbi:unnamed protein product [Acanthoscelides obtectus]|uniref:MADF domain-containing protein n=1 Tax=Acanthoscelides obtectus TaxID=200917 RepID=A0A9P0JNE2_ACAOB|nr:unnamed protein product [Acanthoscelides obtectus]CAK1661835.1 hypothetical protein AOBTE_LOCUS22827 [Acanthoscelides obtectus]
MEITIDSEALILLIEHRTVLWDKNFNTYKNKQLTISAWREICCLLRPDFNELDEKESQAYGKLVSTKWSNLRDAWTRANKKEVKKSGAGANFSKPYIYKEQKVVEQNRTHDSLKNCPPTDEFPEASAAEPAATTSEVPRTSKKQNSMHLDEKMCQFLDSRLSDEERTSNALFFTDFRISNRHAVINPKH